MKSMSWLVRPLILSAGLAQANDRRDRRDRIGARREARFDRRH